MYCNSNSELATEGGGGEGLGGSGGEGGGEGQEAPRSVLDVTVTPTASRGDGMVPHIAALSPKNSRVTAVSADQEAGMV